jgi:hypothetical protein
MDRLNDIHHEILAPKEVAALTGRSHRAAQKTVLLALLWAYLYPTMVHLEVKKLFSLSVPTSSGLNPPAFLTDTSTSLKV